MPFLHDMRTERQRFLQSRRWRNFRKIILSRDMYTCRDCGMTGNEVHHIIELTEDNIDDMSISMNPDNLATLCKECHSKITNKSIDVDEEYVFMDGQVVPLVDLEK